MQDATEQAVTAIQVTFDHSEGIFYLVCFSAASAGAFVRTLRDNRRLRSRVVFGRCFTGGIIGCGITAAWMGFSGSYSASGFVYACATAFIGFFSQEIQDRAIDPIIDMILDKLERMLGGSRRHGPRATGDEGDLEPEPVRVPESPE